MNNTYLKKPFFFLRSALIVSFILLSINGFSQRWGSYDRSSPSIGRTYRLEPAGMAIRWYKGKAYVKKDGRNGHVIIASDGIKEGGLAFEVEIANTSDRAMLVSPEEIYYQLSPGESTSNNRIYSLDPAEELVRIDKEISRQDLGYMRTTGRPSQRWATSNPRNYTGDRLLMEKELWEEKMLRKTTLQPGELIRGYVIFPINPRASKIELIIPVGNENIGFSFQQTRY